MNDKMIINLIEKTLDEKFNLDPNYIKYTFYDLRVKYNLSEDITARFLELLKTKLQNNNYTIYNTGENFKYKGEYMLVQDNELIIAIKQEEGE